MKIDIERESGFCFGVSRAIKMAEEALDRGAKVYCLGEIVHNQKEIDRLTAKGLVFIDNNDLKELRDARVLIRDHGEPPQTYELARKNNLKIIDGTCPIVQKLQKRIREKYLSKEKPDILIYGMENHPEVIGLKGQTEGNAIVIRDTEKLSLLNLQRNVSLFSQTTMDVGGFRELSEKLKSLFHVPREMKLEPEVNDTICRHISHRQPGLEEFAKNHDLIIFVAGKNSSNGKILFEICKKVNPNSYFISEPFEIKRHWFDDNHSVGICGATSTPHWLLHEVADHISEFTII